MAYWCDDGQLDLEQRRLDAMQADAARKIAERANLSKDNAALAQAKDNAYIQR